MITFSCSSCAKRIQADDYMAGGQGECPYCLKIVTSPGKASDGAAARDAQRCAKCGGRRHGTESKCGFCGAAFQGITSTPKTRRSQLEMPEAPDKRKVLIMVGLLVAALCIGGYMFFSGGDEAPKITDDDACRRRMLIELHGALGDQEHSPAGLPPSVGKDFWSSVGTKSGKPNIATCPSSHRTFRGPAKTWKELPADCIIAADADGNHPGGVNVLTRRGEPLWAPAGSDLYKRAMAETKE